MKENGKIYAMNSYNKCVFEYSGQSVAFKCGSWETVEITLTSDCTYLDLFWNVHQAGGIGDSDTVASAVYIDNIVVSTP